MVDKDDGYISYEDICKVSKTNFEMSHKGINLNPFSETKNKYVQLKLRCQKILIHFNK